MCSSAAVLAKLNGVVSGTKMEDMSEYRNQKIFAFHPTLKCGVCVDFWMLNVPHPHTKVCGFRHRHIDIKMEMKTGLSEQLI